MNDDLIVGFTGTQDGMTNKQKFVVSHLLHTLSPKEVHHGDCVGSDKQFHQLARQHSVPIIIHPPIDESKRAFCGGAKIILAPKEYLPRDDDIAKACAVLIGTPKTFEEVLRSGTWATIRYARKYKRKLRIIYPDGSIGTK